MGWERGRYYTRSRKAGGRVVREYVGGGPLGKMAADLDVETRARRQEEAEAWRQERERLEALDAPLKELNAVADLLTRAALLAAGYRQHKRGEWRRPRRRGLGGVADDKGG